MNNFSSHFMSFLSFLFIWKSFIWSPNNICFENRQNIENHFYYHWRVTEKLLKNKKEKLLKDIKKYFLKKKWIDCLSNQFQTKYEINRFQTKYIVYKIRHVLLE